MLKPLTAKQQYWFDHIASAQRNSQSLSDYAAQHNLNIKALYNWRWTFSKQIKNTAPTKTAFVKMLPPTPSVTNREESTVVILPNGIRLQLSALTPALLTMLMQC
jgi:hypothetical protein